MFEVYLGADIYVFESRSSKIYEQMMWSQSMTFKVRVMEFFHIHEQGNDLTFRGQRDRDRQF